MVLSKTKQPCHDDHTHTHPTIIIINNLASPSAPPPLAQRCRPADAGRDCGVCDACLPCLARITVYSRSSLNSDLCSGDWKAFLAPNRLLLPLVPLPPPRLLPDTEMEGEGDSASLATEEEAGDRDRARSARRCWARGVRWAWYMRHWLMNLAMFSAGCRAATTTSAHATGHPEWSSPSNSCHRQAN